MRTEDLDFPGWGDREEVLMHVLMDGVRADEELQYGQLTLKRARTKPNLWYVLHSGRFVNVLQVDNFKALSTLDEALRACGAFKPKEEMEFHAQGAGKTSRDDHDVEEVADER